MDGTRHARPRPTVTAVILAYRRPRTLEIVLDRLAAVPVDEVLVIDNGGEVGDGDVGTHVRVVRPDHNMWLAGFNRGAREAKSDLLLMLDDDAYPQPEAVEHLVEAFRRCPDLAAAGGHVRDVDMEGRMLLSDEPGTFDWWLRGRETTVPPEGVPSAFFPAGACMMDRHALLEAGGFIEEYQMGETDELDLATRLLGMGRDVRYVPAAHFDHMKEASGRGNRSDFRRRVTRNRLWYYYLHFPLVRGARRAAAYLAWDLLLCIRDRAPSAWLAGVVEAWRDRGRVRHLRRALPTDVLRRAEMDLGRRHLKLLANRVVAWGR